MSVQVRGALTCGGSEAQTAESVARLIEVAVSRHALLDVGEVAVCARRRERGRHERGARRAQRVTGFHHCKKYVTIMYAISSVNFTVL